MSDQPPIKPPTNSSKRFAIPTRPTNAAAREAGASSERTPDVDPEQDQEAEASATLIAPKPQSQPGIDTFATQVTSTPEPRSKPQSQPGIDALATQITPKPKSFPEPEPRQKPQPQPGIDALATQITPKPKSQADPQESPARPDQEKDSRASQRQPEVPTEQEPSVYTASTLLLPAARPPQASRPASPTPPPGTLMPPAQGSRPPQTPLRPTPPPGMLTPMPPSAQGPRPPQTPLGPTPTPPPGMLTPTPTPLPGQHGYPPAGPALVPTPTPPPGTPMSNPTPPVQSQRPEERALAVTPLAPERPTMSRQRLWRALPVALIILLLIILIAALLGQQLLNSFRGSDIQGNPPVFSGNGPYVQLPLNAQQINNIQHLAGYMNYKALASLYVSHMSLDDEIGQLIMVEYNQPTYSSDLDYMINTLHVGGVIMYEFQMTTASQTKGDIAHMQERANIPLLISTDEEGGPYVHRLSNIYGYRMSATQIGESGSLDVARQQGLKTSQDLAALGINEDLAPDVDVNQVNGYDMVTRTFGNTADQVIQFAGAYLQAMQGNGTIACIKHFPGLGGALTDAHTGLPVVHSTKQQIYDTDLAPFKAFIQSPTKLLNPGMIMPTDVLMPAIDPKYPAELSHTFMTDILRDQFGYDGVVLTDALYMQGITDTWDMYTASVMALQAGDDMLLGANGTQQTLGVINAIKHALQDGQLTKARIDESVARIIALKMQYHLMPTYTPEV